MPRLLSVITMRTCMVSRQRLLQGVPHLSRAGSIMSGLLVAAIRYTDWRPSVPSISVNSWFTTLSVDWFTSEPRLGARASSSSKKRTHGEAARALVNSCLTARSLSPTYLFSNSGPWIRIHTPISRPHGTLGLSPILLAVIGGPSCIKDAACVITDQTGTGSIKTE